VKTPMSNRTPPTRCITIACDETSITMLRAPAPYVERSKAWRSVLSGVVRTAGRVMPSNRIPVVPINRGLRPAAHNPASTRYDVVVLPLVPVIPTDLSFDWASPWIHRAICAMSERGSALTMTGTVTPSMALAPSASVRIATAPAAIAASANSAPCRVKPGSAANTSPEAIKRLSCEMPLTVSLVAAASMPMRASTSSSRTAES